MTSNQYYNNNIPAPEYLPPPIPGTNTGQYYGNNNGGFLANNPNVNQNQPPSWQLPGAQWNGQPNGTPYDFS